MLRWLSVLVLVAVFAFTSAVHMSKTREPWKREVPFWYTTFLSIVIITAPFLIWRNARLDPTQKPSFEGAALLIIILLAHFVHSVSEDGDAPANSRPWLWRGIGTIVGGIVLAGALSATESIA